MRLPSASLALLALLASGCGAAPARRARPRAPLLAELVRLGRNEASRDRVRVYADGTAEALLGHGGGGQTTARLTYTPAGFVRLRALLARTDVAHPGRPGRDPGLRGGSVYLYVLRLHGRVVRAAQGAEPRHVRAAMRALSALADGGGPVRRRSERRTGPAPNAS